MGESKLRHDLGIAPRIIKPGEPIPVTQDMLDKATQEACECGCNYFLPVVRIYTISAILSPVGKEMTASKPALICAKCKKMWEPKKEDQ